MGFLDKAKAAASDLAAKADSALNSSGAGAGAGGPRAADTDKYFRDLGLLTYLEATGRPGDPADRERVMSALQQLDQAGALRSFALHTAPPPAPGMAGQVPPPPGMAGMGGAAVPPPPGMGGTTPPPMPGVAAPAAPPAPVAAPVEEAPAAPAAPVPPPPPPSWA